MWHVLDRILLGVKSADVRVDFVNSYDVIYTGKLYMGTTRKPVNLIWDTGTDWTVVEINTCTNC